MEETAIAPLDSSNAGVGIGFRYHPSGQYHVGLYYPDLDENEQDWLFHFGWERDVRDELLGPQYFKFPFQVIDSSEAKVLIGTISMLANKNAAKCDPVTKQLIKESAPIRYAFVSPEHGVFDAHGNFLPLPLGEGMTCATFVHRVLLYGGYKTIEIDSIDECAEDEEWQRSMAKLLSDDDMEHKQAVLDSIPARRLRPELMAATAELVEAWELKHSHDLEWRARRVIERARESSMSGTGALLPAPAPGISTA